MNPIKISTKERTESQLPGNKPPNITYWSLSSTTIISSRSENVYITTNFLQLIASIYSLRMVAKICVLLFRNSIFPGTIFYGFAALWKPPIWWVFSGTFIDPVCFGDDELCTSRSGCAPGRSWQLFFILYKLNNILRIPFDTKWNQSKNCIL